jgi:hypothetical protein
MWPFRKKAEQQLEPETVEVTVYVRDLMINMDINDVMLVAMALSNHISWFSGVAPPDFPYITERQYQALPERCQSYFVQRQVTLPIAK